MDIGKSDEAGTVGEEVVRALRDLRKQPQTSFSCIGLIGTIVLSIYLHYRIARFFETTAQKRSYWEGIILLLIVTLVIVVSIIRERKEQRPYVELRRGPGIPALLRSRIEIWTGATVVARAVGPVIAFVVGIVLLLIGVGLANGEEDPGLGLAGIASLCWCAVGVRSIFQPLLRVDEEGISVLSRNLSWSRIERVQISGLCNNESMYWDFFGDGGKRLAKVSTITDKRTLPQQEAVVVALVGALNAEFQVVRSKPLALSSKGSL